MLCIGEESSGIYSSDFVLRRIGNQLVSGAWLPSPGPGEERRGRKGKMMVDATWLGQLAPGILIILIETRDCNARSFQISPMIPPG